MNKEVHEAIKDGLKMKALNEAASKHMIQWNPDAFVQSHPSLLRTIFSAMDIYRGTAQKISGDGVFFRRSGCEYEPEMSRDKDDLLEMNYCPNCGCKFEK